MAEITVHYEGPIVTRADAISRGLGRYFTGRPCKHGHISERYAKNRGCLCCATIRNQIAEYKEAQRLRRASIGLEARRAYDREYNQREDRKAASRVYRAAYNRTEKRKRWHARWVAVYRQTEEYKIRARASIAKHRTTDKGKAGQRSYNAKRRALKRAAPGIFTAADYQKLLAHQKRCHICAAKFTTTNPPTLDHVIALADGGPHDPSNIALACYLCNAKKRAVRTHLI